MRKIEQQMIKAILHKQTKGLGNTVINSYQRDQFNNGDNPNHTDVTLHGNLIASIDWPAMRIQVSHCGWKTVTTKSRLNALLRRFCAVSVYQEKGVWYYSGKNFNFKEKNKWNDDCNFFDVSLISPDRGIL